MIDTLLRFVKRLCAGGIVAIVLFVAALTYFGGEQTTVTARGLGPTPCDVTIAGQCARHLTTTTRVPTTTVDNRSATGTVAKPSTTIVSYGPERPCNPGGTDILLVTDGRSVCIIRTTITAQLVWALTTYGVN